MSNSKIKKRIALATGRIMREYSDRLLAEYFRYVEGQFDNLTIDVRDICDLEQPTPEYVGKALSRYCRIWKEFCRINKLPGESQNLLMVKAKGKWIEENWEERLSAPKKRKRAAKS